MFHDAEQHEQHHDDIELHDIAVTEEEEKQASELAGLAPVLGDFKHEEKVHVSQFLRGEYDEWAKTQTGAHKRRVWLQIIVAHSALLFLALIYFSMMYGVLVSPVESLRSEWAEHNECYVKEGHMDIHASDVSTYALAKATITYTQPATASTNATEITATATRRVQLPDSEAAEEAWLTEVLGYKDSGLPVHCWIDPQNAYRVSLQNDEMVDGLAVLLMVLIGLFCALELITILLIFFQRRTNFFICVSSGEYEIIDDDDIDAPYASSHGGSGGANSNSNFNHGNSGHSDNGQHVSVHESGIGNDGADASQYNHAHNQRIYNNDEMQDVVIR